MNEKDSGNQAAAHPDFGGVEFPRGRSYGTESELKIKNPKAKGGSTKLSAAASADWWSTFVPIQDTRKQFAARGALHGSVEVK